MQGQFTLVVGGTRYGTRDVSPPLSPVEAFYRYRGMLKLGYKEITITDASTGDAFESGGFVPRSNVDSPPARQRAGAS